MTREQPPRGSAEWREQREILKLVHQSWLDDVDAQIVQPLVAVDTNVLPYLRTLAAYQEYYDLYGD